MCVSLSDTSFVAMPDAMYIPEELRDEYNRRHEQVFGDASPPQYALLSLLLEHSDVGRKTDDGNVVVDNDETVSVAD